MSEKVEDNGSWMCTNEDGTKHYGMDCKGTIFGYQGADISVNQNADKNVLINSGMKKELAEKIVEMLEKYKTVGIVISPYDVLAVLHKLVATKQAMSNIIAEIQNYGKGK